MHSQTRRYRGGANFKKILEACPLTKKFNDTKEKILPLRITTLLGHLARNNGENTHKEADFEFDEKDKTFTKLIPKTLEYTYEAMLGQCAFLCRLVYSPTDIFLQGVSQGMELLPKEKNTLITKLEYESFKERPDYQSWFISKNVLIKDPVNRGKFYPISNTAIFQHYNVGSKINPKRTVYVVCKGTSNIKETVKDMKFFKTELSNSPIFKGAPGFVHKGFFDHVIDELKDILADIQAYALPDIANASNSKTKAENATASASKQKPFITPTQADRIIITGHSLGGASATLIALALAHARIPGLPIIHCVTFGAPKLLSDDSRIYFNEFLLNGAMTYDRVVVNGDFITNIPPGPTVHPGFRILQMERIKSPFNKSGRSGYIDDIRRLSADIKRSEKTPKNEVQWNLENHPILKDIYNTGVVIVAPSMSPVAIAAASELVEQPPAPKGAQDGGSRQVGGLALTKAANIYKEMTKKMYPNTVNYECAMQISKGFCHCGYMQIGFAAALQLPVGPKGFMPRNALGKRTMFISGPGKDIEDRFKPENRMYVVEIQMQLAETPANATVAKGGYTRRQRVHLVNKK
jgi:hypothetical protein